MKKSLIVKDVTLQSFDVIAPPSPPYPDRLYRDLSYWKCPQDFLVVCFELFGTPSVFMFCFYGHTCLGTFVYVLPMLNFVGQSRL